MRISTTQNLSNNLISHIKKFLVNIAVIMLWLTVWQLIYLFVGTEAIIPSPVSTAKRVAELCSTTQFWVITGTSVLRILTGYLCGAAIGVTLACVTAAAKILYTLFKPIIIIARATPVASLTLIIIVWVTNKSVPLFIVGLMVFPIVWSNTYQGIKNTDKDLLEMAKCYKAGIKNTLKFVYIPSVYPYFLSGALTALGLSWKSGVAAEILGTTQGSVGQQLNTAKVELDSEGKFAWTVVVIIMSLIFEKVISRLLKKISFRFHIKAKSAVLPNTNSCEIKALGITKKFGDNLVLSGITFNVRSGETVAITGASGAGKTTLLRILALLDKPDSGRIITDATKTAFLFQENRLLPWLTVRENILFVNRNANVDNLLDMLNLPQCADMYPKELSGGMKRRVAIARTLAADFDLVLLDEPFTGLDEALQEQVAARVFSLLSEKAVVFVTHNTMQVQKFANKKISIS